MHCTETEEDLSGYLDKELPQQKRQRLEIHLRTCRSCQKTLALLQEAQATAERLSLPEPSREEWTVMQIRIFERMPRRLGWLILVVWTVVTSAYALFHLATSPTEPLFEKILIFGLFLGVGLLFLSVLFERVREQKTDRYKGVIK